MRKLGLVALLLTVLSSAFATEKDDIKVTSDSSAIFRVYYSKPEVSVVKVTIYDEKGQKIFSERIKNKEGFVRPYNMKALPTGVYRFEVVDNNEVKEFEYHYGDQTFRKSSTSDLLASVKKMDAERFLLALGNANNNTVSISIINEKNEVVYSATEFVEKQFAQLYNLKSIRSEQLIFKIVSDSGEVEEFIF